MRGALGFLFSTDPIRNYLGEQDVMNHILLFAPVGVLLPSVFSRGRGIVMIAVLTALVFTAEAAQGLLVPSRLYDIDQAIVGLVAGLAGALAANWIHLFASLGRFATR